MREPLARLFADGDGDEGRDEPQPGDVAVHQESPSFHAAEGDAADWDGVRFVAERVARATLCLDPCPHCQTDADELGVDPA